MSDQQLFILCALVLTFIGGWQFLAWLYAPKPMAKDLSGRRPLLHIKASLTDRQKAALHRGGYRFVIVPDDEGEGA